MDTGFNDPKAHVVFNEHQKLIPARFDVQVGLLQRSTIGHWLNERQLNLIIVLGAKQDAAESGLKQETYSVTECKKSIQEDYSVSDVTAQKDIDMLVDADLIEKASVENHGTKKDVRLSVNGQKQYSDYANGRVALHLAATKAIKQVGATPPCYADKILKWVIIFMTRAGKTSGAVVLCLGLAAATPERIWHGSTAIAATSADGTDFLDKHLPKLDIAPQAADYQFADGTDFLDKYLPKSYA